SQKQCDLLQNDPLHVRGGSGGCGGASNRTLAERSTPILRRPFCCAAVLRSGNLNISLNVLGQTSRSLNEHVQLAQSNDPSTLNAATPGNCVGGGAIGELVTRRLVVQSRLVVTVRLSDSTPSPGPTI